MISELSFTPRGAYVDSGNGQASVSGTVSFSDPDGDLSTVTLHVLDAASQIVVSEVTQVTGAAGVTSGTLQGSVTVSTTVIGDYTVQVFVTDRRGLRSNQLEGTFRITEFPWISRTPMPTPRLEFATANVGGLIYVIGGADALAPVVPRPPMGVVETYDPSEDSWSTGPAMQVAVSNHMVAEVAGKIYVIGGEPDIWPGTNAVQEYDPATQTWSMKTPIPYAMYSSAVAVHDDLIYIAGGEPDGRTLLWYDPAMDSWHSGSPLNQSRAGPGGAAMDGQIIVYGGFEGIHVQDAGYLRSVEVYDPLLDVWSDRAQGEPRRDFGVAVFNGSMYAFGGRNLSWQLPWVAAYDNASGSWTDKTPMPVSMGFARAEVVNDRIYVFGTSDTLVYTPLDDTM